MSETIIVSIGRNVAGTPMGPDAWRAFRKATRWVVETAAEVVFDGVGTGVYEGATEESYTVIATTNAVDEVGSYWLRRMLSHLASVYSQEAIALTVGTTTFIEGER